MAFNLPKQSITKGSVVHKSLLKQRKSMLRQEETTPPPEEKRNIIDSFTDFLRKPIDRSADEGKSPHEIKLEKDLKRMQNFGDASKFEIKAMERRIARAKADRVVSVEEEAAPPSEEPKPTGYYTKGTQAYLNRFKEGGDLDDRPKPEGWWDPESPNYGGEIEGKPVGYTASTSRPTGYYDKTSENYMKGVENRPLKEMPFFSPERIAYYEARNWDPDKTVDRNFGKEEVDPKGLVEEDKDKDKFVPKDIPIIHPSFTPSIQASEQLVAASQIGEGDTNFGKVTGIHAQEGRGGADAPYQGIPSTKEALEGEYYQNINRRIPAHMRPIYQFKNGKYIAMSPSLFG